MMDIPNEAVRLSRRLQSDAA